MSSPTQRHSNNFNLIRLVFALLVLLAHAPELADGNRGRELLTQVFHTLSFGDLAVDGFFLLSGYLIVQSWCMAPRIWPFLKKRILRIYPAFIVATLVSVFLVAPLGVANVNDYFSQLSLPRILRGLIALRQPSIPDVFQGQPYPMVNGAMWTISYEFKCYLAVLVMGMIGLAHRRFVWLVATAGLYGLLAYFRIKLADGQATEASTLIQAGLDYLRLSSLFFTGACFYQYREMVKLSGRGAAIATAVLICGMFIPVAWELLLAPLGGYILFYAGFKSTTCLSGFNKWPDVSYGVYLYGWPLQKLTFWWFPTMSPWLVFLASGIASLAMGLFSWHLVEKPCLRFKQTKPVSSTLVSIAKS